MKSLPKQPRFLWTILCVSLIFACQTYSPIQLPTSTSETCETATEPTQQDIDFSLDFGNDIFSSTDWTRSYTVESQRVSVSWLNNEASAVAYLDYLIFSCGYTTAELEEYFGDAYWGILFQNYESYEPIRDCGSFGRGLALHEFTAISDGLEYQVRYWIRPEVETRVLTMFLVFPVDADEAMDSYSRIMFPSLTACEG